MNNVVALLHNIHAWRCKNLLENFPYTARLLSFDLVHLSFSTEASTSPSFPLPTFLSLLIFLNNHLLLGCWGQGVRSW